MRKKAKILIVDDDPLNVKLMKASLSVGAYECVSAYSGAEALEMVGKEPPDLILLDIMMPGIDGYQVAAKLKDDPDTRDIPIILVTALDGTDNKVHGLEAGADEFLNKPVHTAELLARVKSLLRLKHYQDQLKGHRRSVGRVAGELNEEAGVQRRIDLPSILLVEDDDQDVRLIQMQLYGQPYELKVTGSGEEALSWAQQEKIDLILLDILLPGMDGFEVVKQLREKEQTRNIQIVALTCLQDLESKVKGIELGVDDYLIKPINGCELKARINALIKKKAYMDSLQSGYQSAVHSAITDRLTGLYNYAYFYHFAENEIKRCERSGHAFALVMMDVDDFKRINDMMGHLAGDEILSELASLISGKIREIDVAFRYGGEEFSLVLPYTDLKGAMCATERLRKVISGHSFLADRCAGSRTITVSMGIAIYPKDADSLQALVERADRALYRAKGEGKNRISVHGANSQKTDE